MNIVGEKRDIRRVAKYDIELNTHTHTKRQENKGKARMRETRVVDGSEEQAPGEGNSWVLRREKRRMESKRHG